MAKYGSMSRKSGTRGGGIRKSTPVKGLSPKVGTNPTKKVMRASAGEKGRAYPPGCDSTKQRKGNP